MDKPTRRTWLATAVVAIAYGGLLMSLFGAKALAADDVVSNISVVVGWFLTVSVVTYQLRAGRDDSDRAKREELRSTMNLEAFRQVAAAAVDLTKSLSGIMAPFGTATVWLKSPPIPDDRSIQRLAADIPTAQVEIHRCWAQFVYAVESYQIVLLPFEHLRTYIGFRVFDVGEAIGRLQSKVGWHPTDIDEQKRSELSADTSAIWAQIWDVMTYVGDYRVEVMNALTGDFFDRRVPRRQPLHPSKKTLTQLASKADVDREEQQRIQVAILGVHEPSKPTEPPS